MHAHRDMLRPNGEVEMDPKKILAYYLGGWFLIDFLACFPFELLLGSVSDDNRQVDILFRALKLPRLLRLGRLWKFLDKFKYAGTMKIVRFTFFIVLVAHWSGCMFFFTCYLHDPTGGVHD